MACGIRLNHEPTDLGDQVVAFLLEGAQKFTEPLHLVGQNLGLRLLRRPGNRIRDEVQSESPPD